MGIVIMDRNDQKLFNLSMEVIYGRLTISEFAILIKKSYRQSQRIIKKVKDKGIAGVKHGNTGKIPHNKTDPALVEDVLSLLKTKYYDFNITHFQEKLVEDEGIFIGKKVIYNIAKKHGMIKRPKRRKKEKLHKPRPRMPREGMLVQFDGSVHKWFGNFESDLIGGIDDATGEVVGAEFFIGETSLNCMKVMKDITLSKGIPQAYYLDRAGYFGKNDREQVSTQIGRALESLNCNVILANSPQAKGRIERLWNTFQDRLIAELRLYGIKTIVQANRFLKDDFLPRYNKKFSVVPRESTSSYRNWDLDTNQLENIFCMKERRKITAGSTFSWNGEIYIINESRDYRFRTININTHYDGSISFDILGKPIKVKKYFPMPRQLSKAS